MLNRFCEIFAPTSGVEIDSCRVRDGSDKGKGERSVGTVRGAFADTFRRGAGCLEDLQHRLGAVAEALLERLERPVTRISVRAGLGSRTDAPAAAAEHGRTLRCGGDPEGPVRLSGLL